jgi:hypothetical protein
MTHEGDVLVVKDRGKEDLHLIAKVISHPPVRICSIR